jgi:putative hydrolase of the HAD superfamily
MIRTIIFDLSEVLIAGLLGIEKSIAAQVGISEAQVLSTFNTPALQDLFCGKLSEDAFLTSILQRQAWDMPVDQLKRVVRENFQQRVPDMDAILEHLHQRYELVLLSDHAREWIMYIDSIHPFLQNFTARYFSFELQQTKRMPSTFQKILAQLHRQPEDCLFIDDSPVNIQAAESVGIKSTRFTTAPALLSKLTELRLIVTYSLEDT